jgi:hypothetical protein
MESEASFAGATSIGSSISRAIVVKVRSLDRWADLLLPLPSDNPKNAWRKPEVVTVEDDEPPPPKKETVKVRSTRRPSLHMTGPIMLGVVVQENPPNGYVHKVVGIGSEKGEKSGVLSSTSQSGKLTGSRLY